METMTSVLRRLIADDGVTMIPGATDALTARLVERAGFPAVYMTGSGTAQTKFGVPDIGLITMSEMVANAAAMTAAIGVPLIADADTGYGNPLNVRRTVQEFERAGVAGLHLEDQVTPKKCGQFLGKQLVPVAEHAAKIRAACEARRDPDFVVIARTDALIVEGVETLLERVAAYTDAGADMLFVEGPRSVDELRFLGAETDLPLLYNMTSSGKSPFLTADELAVLGDYRIMILPNYVLQAMIGAAQQVLEAMYTARSAAPALAGEVSWTGRQEVVDLAYYQELEERYGVAPGARTAYQEGVY